MASDSWGSLGRLQDLDPGVVAPSRDVVQKVASRHKGYTVALSMVSDGVLPQGGNVPFEEIKEEFASHEDLLRLWPKKGWWTRISGVYEGAWHRPRVK